MCNGYVNLYTNTVTMKSIAIAQRNLQADKLENPWDFYPGTASNSHTLSIRFGHC